MRVRILWRWGRDVPMSGTVVDLDDTPELRARIADGHAEVVSGNVTTTPEPAPTPDPEAAEAAEAGYAEPETYADGDGAAEAGYGDPEATEPVRALIALSVPELKERLAEVDDPALLESALAAERAGAARIGAMSAIASRMQEIA